MKITKILITIILSIFLFTQVFASENILTDSHEEDDGHSVQEHAENFEKAQEIITAGTLCDNLQDYELGIVGEFFMEQMHPGEETEKSFIADKEGEYDFACTQHYGKGHMMHKGKLIVEE